jgi:hypothetical protein
MVLFGVYLRFVLGPVSQYYGTSYHKMAGLGLADDEGRQTGIFVEGFALYTALLIAMHYKVIYMTTTHTWVNWFFIGISMIGFIFFAWMYGLFPAVDFYNIVPEAFSLPSFWLILFIAPTLMIMVDVVLDRIIDEIWPNAQTKIKDLIKQDSLSGEASIANDPSAENPMLSGFMVKLGLKREDATQTHAASGV